MSRLNKFYATILSLVMTVTLLPMGAYAQEAETPSSVQPFVETPEMTRESVIESLGLTGEDAENVQLFTYEADILNDQIMIPASIPMTLNPGTYDDTFSFSGTNTGNSRKYNGNRLAIAIHLASADYSTASLDWSFRQYNGVTIQSASTGVGQTTQRGFFDITYGIDYYFYYVLRQTPGSGYLCSGTVIVVLSLL